MGKLRDEQHGETLRGASFRDARIHNLTEHGCTPHTPSVGTMLDAGSRFDISCSTNGAADVTPLRSEALSTLRCTIECS